MPIKYEIFISYASDDRPWAIRFVQSLAERRKWGLFYDKDSLRTGSSWQAQLEAALDTSRHFIVLWSNLALEPQRWVRTEIAQFQARNALRPQENGRLFYVPLEGGELSLEHLQGLTDLRDAGLYQRGPAGMTDPDRVIWDRTINRIINDIEGANPALSPVPVAILATTAAQFPSLDPNKAVRLDTVLQDLGGMALANLVGRYGTTVRDWRPFGTECGILDVLAKAQQQINRQLLLRGCGVRWELLDLPDPDTDPAFIPTMEQIAQRMKNEPSVVIIDPVSLYHPAVYEQFRYLAECFQSDNTLMLALSPTARQRRSPVGEVLQHFARPVLNAYFEPPVPLTGIYPNLDAQIDYEPDVARLMLATIAQRIRPSAGAVYLGS